MISPALDVRTTAIDDPGNLIDWLSPRHPLAFLRLGDGLVGVGEALRLQFTGANRIADAAAAWRTVAAAAHVADAVGLPGTGLVAFGSFAFADVSEATSVLVVPSILIGRREAVAWITRVNGAEVPPRQPAGGAALASFRDGSAEAFVASVESAQHHGIGTSLRKVVLARSITGSLDPDADLRAPLGRLAVAYPDTFTFAVDGLVGASPETLVRSVGGAVSARVLAGSSAREADATADAIASELLAASSKDREEHRYAVQSVVGALTPHTTSLVASREPYALRLPNLWHLATDVTGALADGASALDLVRSLHPTAAVAGTPTAAASALIAALEPADRGRYAGPVGWIDGNGDGEWAIALRCAHVDDDRVTAWAGAGIVESSDPRRELAETELKFAPIREAFRADD